jgi:glycosyltransferase involved in cell wall biosynthesis
MKKLLIFVPTYNRFEKLKISIGALLHQVAGLEDEIAIHVSNNASTDGTLDYLRSLSHPALTFDTNDSNIGASRNVLKAFALKDLARFTWIIGDDDYVINGALRRVVTAIDQNTDVDIFFLNTLSVPQRYQAEIAMASIGTSRTLAKRGVLHSKIRRDFRCELKDLINPRIDSVFGGAVMCYAFRADRMMDVVTEKLVAYDYTQAEACYPHTLNWLYSLRPSSPALHLHEPFTANVWHGGAEWGTDGFDWVVTHGLGHLFYEAIRLGYISDADRPAYFRHYMATARASFEKLTQKHGPDGVPFADSVKSELFSLTLADVLERHGRKLDRRQRIKRILRRAIWPFSRGGAV